MQNQTVFKHPLQEKIVQATCEYFEVSEDDLITGSKYYIVYMRWLCFWLTKQNTLLSMDDIGARLRKKTPAVYNAIENIEVRKKIYVQTVCDLKKIAEKAGISNL